ncbi:MAG: cytochrome P450 [Chloroflexi bacterium OLB15]|nr:MAG: cytochrome P450 [Chloroflexi bacterium OLB15]
MVEALAEAQLHLEAAGCPAEDERKGARQNYHAMPRIEIGDDGVWHVYGYDEARQILRSDLAKQAGFLAEKVLDERARSVMKNLPILYLEGDEHHRMRRETNKFFTPAITDKQYREFMDAYADELIAKLKQKGSADLSDMTMEMALKVAAQIVGLTSSIIPGLNARLNGLLKTANDMAADSPPFVKAILGQRYLISFLYLDVKPAIRARRKNPQNDVISYLISRGYSDLEILTECVVYGVAGMVTTREFICMALWHLMEKPHLRQRMLVGSQEERYAILHEILRLEPIVGHVLRRITGEIEIESEGEKVTIPEGTMVDLNIFAANIDTKMAGETSTSICPARPLHSALGKVPEPVLSFSDGYHRCPGAFVAIQESDIFLRKLLAVDTLRLERKPDVIYNEVVKGYELRNFVIKV